MNQLTGEFSPTSTVHNDFVASYLRFGSGVSNGHKRPSDKDEHHDRVRDS